LYFFRKVAPVSEEGPKIYPLPSRQAFQDNQTEIRFIGNPLDSSIDANQDFFQGLLFKFITVPVLHI
ncbi:MAG: hypothetical protein Q7U30_06190, partial [Methylicorpusculum sp.]|nr:hypothetical protein [Methylicorpusculum sp.]